MCTSHQYGIGNLAPVWRYWFVSTLTEVLPFSRVFNSWMLVPFACLTRDRHIITLIPSPAHLRRSSARNPLYLFNRVQSDLKFLNRASRLFLLIISPRNSRLILLTQILHISASISRPEMLHAENTLLCPRWSQFQKRKPQVLDLVDDIKQVKDSQEAGLLTS